MSVATSAANGRSFGSSESIQRTTSGISTRKHAAGRRNALECLKRQAAYCSSERRASLFWAEKILLIVHTFQILALLWTFGRGWPLPQRLQDATRWLTWFNLDAPAYFSYIDDNANPPALRGSVFGMLDNFWIIAVCWAWLPPLLFAAGRIACCFARSRGRHVHAARTRFADVTVIALVFLQLPAVLALSRVFVCEPHPLFDGQQRLAVEPSFQCFSWQHIALMGGCGPSLLLYGVILPLWLAARVRRCLVYSRRFQHERYLRWKEAEHVHSLSSDWQRERMWLMSSFVRGCGHPYDRPLWMLLCSVLVAVLAGARASTPIQADIFFAIAALWSLRQGLWPAYRCGTTNALAAVSFALTATISFWGVMRGHGLKSSLTVDSAWAEAVWGMGIALFASMGLLLAVSAYPGFGWPRGCIGSSVWRQVLREDASDAASASSASSSAALSAAAAAAASTTASDGTAVSKLSWLGGQRRNGDFTALSVSDEADDRSGSGSSHSGSFGSGRGAYDAAANVAAALGMRRVRAVRVRSALQRLFGLGGSSPASAGRSAQGGMIAGGDASSATGGDGRSRDQSGKRGASHGRSLFMSPAKVHPAPSAEEGPGKASRHASADGLAHDRDHGHGDGNHDDAAHDDEPRISNAPPLRGVPPLRLHGGGAAADDHGEDGAGVAAARSRGGDGVGDDGDDDAADDLDALLAAREAEFERAVAGSGMLSTAGGGAAAATSAASGSASASASAAATTGIAPGAASSSLRGRRVDPGASRAGAPRSPNPHSGAAGSNAAGAAAAVDDPRTALIVRDEASASAALVDAEAAADAAALTAARARHLAAADEPVSVAEVSALEAVWVSLLRDARRCLIAAHRTPRELVDVPLLRAHARTLRRELARAVLCRHVLAWSIEEAIDDLAALADAAAPVTALPRAELQALLPALRAHCDARELFFCLSHPRRRVMLLKLTALAAWIGKRPVKRLRLRGINDIFFIDPGLLTAAQHRATVTGRPVDLVRLADECEALLSGQRSFADAAGGASAASGSGSAVSGPSYLTSLGVGVAAAAAGAAARAANPAALPPSAGAATSTPATAAASSTAVVAAGGSSAVTGGGATSAGPAASAMSAAAAPAPAAAMTVAAGPSSTIAAAAAAATAASAASRLMAAAADEEEREERTLAAAYAAIPSDLRDVGPDEVELLPERDLREFVALVLPERLRAETKRWLARNRRIAAALAASGGPAASNNSPAAAVSAAQAPARPARGSAANAAPLSASEVVARSGSILLALEREPPSFDGVHGRSAVSSDSRDMLLAAFERASELVEDAVLLTGRGSSATSASDAGSGGSATSSGGGHPPGAGPSPAALRGLLGNWMLQLFPAEAAERRIRMYVPSGGAWKASEAIPLPQAARPQLAVRASPHLSTLRIPPLSPQAATHAADAAAPVASGVGATVGASTAAAVATPQAARDGNGSGRSGGRPPLAVASPRANASHAQAVGHTGHGALFSSSGASPSSPSGLSTSSGGLGLPVGLGQGRASLAALRAGIAALPAVDERTRSSAHHDDSGASEASSAVPTEARHGIGAGTGLSVPVAAAAARTTTGGSFVDD